MKHTVVYYIDSQEFGGTEQIVYTMLKDMDRTKWEPVLIHHPFSGITQFIEKVRELDVDIVCLPEIKNFFDIAGFARFVRALKEIQPSVFHAHLAWHLRCSYGIVCAFLSRVPALLSTQHAYIRPKSRKLVIYQKLILLLIDRYIAVSCSIASMLEKDTFFKDRVVVIYNGIYIEDFSNPTRSNLRLELDLDVKTPIVMTVARMDKYKGHMSLLKTVPMVPDAIFILVGDGPEKANFQAYAANTGIENRVIFLGYRDDIPALLNSCDIFVHPSLFESLGLAVIEAMAAGKPVVASDISGLDEVVVNGKTGLLVPKENPKALAAAISSLILNPDYARELGQAGKVRAEQRFSANTMLARISKVYEELLGS